MRNQIRKLIIIASIVGLVVLTVSTVVGYMNKNTIRGVDDQSYLLAVNDILSPTNSRFTTSNISIKNISYINSNIALVNIYTKSEGITVHTVFELRDGHLNLTNYTSAAFSANDFLNSSDDSVKAIINMVSKS